MTWSEISDWWVNEVETDPAYAEVVTPLVLDLLQPRPGARYLDLGCGEGRVMREIESLGASALGIDISEELAARAGRAVVGDITVLPFQKDMFDGAYSVLVMEHVEDHRAMLREAARVVRADGEFVLLINHPVWTAPQSTPIGDSDGETLWRPGEYFTQGTSQVPAGEGSVTFHHRSMSELLSSAADEGWSLEQMVELPHHEIVDQAGIPRLLACRWRLLR